MQMLQPAENIHLIGVDPLDPTRSTYVATGDSGQVPALLGSSDKAGMLRLPNLWLPAQPEIISFGISCWRAALLPTIGSQRLQVATMAATAADVLTDVLNDRSSPYADVRPVFLLLRHAKLIRSDIGMMRIAAAGPT